MEALACTQQTRPTRSRPREFDCGLHSLAAATAEEHFAQLTARKVAKPARKLPGEFRHMTLQHGWTATVHFLFQHLDYIGMIVTDVVNAVAGEIVENASSVSGEELGSKAPIIL